MIRVALSSLLARGVDLDVAEALAIAQTLASKSGVPAVGNVEIGSDGTAACMNERGEPSVSALAALLDALLPPAGVPAPLRYAVARGMGVVDAPPFASVAAFSQALARFEAGDRADAIRRLLARARPAAVVAAAPPAAAVPPPVSREVHPRRALAVAAALLLSALAGFAGAELMRVHRARPVAATTPPAAASVVQASAEQVRGTAGRIVEPTRTPRLTPKPQLTPERELTPEPAKEQTGRIRAAVPQRALPMEHAPAFSPAFSPNGTALFFQTGGAHDPSSAIAVAASGRWPADDLRIMKVVDDGARNYHAQPSPDGQMIAFDSDRDGVRGVYVATRDGSGVRRISGPGYAALPTWSPDGRRLAYVRAEAGAPSVWNLWVQPLEAGAPRRLTNYRYGQTWSASWFPDGRRIAYSHEDVLTILDLDRGRELHYAAPVHGRLVRTPAVSPDGSRIVFQVFRAGAWMLDVRDGSMECVLADPTAEEFAWAPDGRRFAFHSRRDGEWGVYVLSASPAAP